jgi:hypothetical protein
MAASKNLKKTGTIHTDLSRETPTDRADTLLDFGLHVLGVGRMTVRSRGPRNNPVSTNIAYTITCGLAAGGAWVGHQLGAPPVLVGIVAAIVFLTGVGLVLLSMRGGRHCATRNEEAVDEPHRSQARRGAGNRRGDRRGSGRR